MLVLSRKRLEEVVIDGGRIRIKVVGIQGDTVRLGFQADRSVRIDRAEVDDSRAREKSANIRQI